MELPKTSALLLLTIIILFDFVSFPSIKAWQSACEGEIEVRWPAKIVSYGVTLKGKVVRGTVNVTILSQLFGEVAPASEEILCRFLLMSPSGEIVFDNFRGVGGPVDFKKITVSSNKVTTAAFQVDFESAVKEANPKHVEGIYSYSFAIYGNITENGNATLILFDTTGWKEGFFFIPPEVTVIDLGLVYENTLIFHPVNITFSRFQSVRFTFNLTDSLTSLTIWLTSVMDSKYTATLNHSGIAAYSQFLPASSPLPVPVPPAPGLHLLPMPLEGSYWRLYNLPAGLYNLSLTTISNQAYLLFIILIPGPKIISPSIGIEKLQATASHVTPDGEMSYYIFVRWNITSFDVLNIQVFLEKQLINQMSSPVSPLSSYNGRDFYLTIKAPSQLGNYELNFKVELVHSGVITESKEICIVRPEKYNITVKGKVMYYKLEREFIGIIPTPNLKRIEFDDPSKLSALEVTNIEIAQIDSWTDDGKPKSATIKFNAHNKVSGEILQAIKLGSGVHYRVEISWGNNPRAVLAILLAGDNETIYAHNVPISKDGTLDFTIIYSMWWEGSILEIGASIIQTMITVITSGIGGILAEFIVEFAKLCILYLGKEIIEVEHGYISSDTVISFLENLGILRMETTFEILEEITDNPYFALLSVIFEAYRAGAIDLLRTIHALIKLTIHCLSSAAHRIGELIQKAVLKVLQKVKTKITDKIREEIAKLTPEKFLGKLIDTIFSVCQTIITIAWHLISPQEEGKVISGTEVGHGEAMKLDPTVKISFHGPTSNTNLTYFGDIYTIYASINSSNAFIVFEVDPQLVSVYLPIFSDSGFRQNILTYFGFNATRTELVWEEGENIFVITGIGSTFDEIKMLRFSINQTLICGEYKTSTAALLTNNQAILNRTFLYPFGKNLNYTIEVTLPHGSIIKEALPTNYVLVENYTIKWSTPIDYLYIVFVPPQDKTPPVTTLHVGNPLYISGSNLYITGLTEISISSVDEGQGTAYTKYKIDDGPWLNYSIPFTLDGYQDGPHTIYFYSVDIAGNIEATINKTVILDNESPTTTCEPLSGTYYAPIKLTLTSVDVGCGVNQTFYKIGENGKWTVYSGQIELSQPGNYTIYFYSVDNLQNSEEIKATHYKIIEHRPSFQLWLPIITISCLTVLTAYLIKKRYKGRKNRLIKSK